MYKLDLEKAEETEIKLPTSTGSQEKKKNPKENTYFCFIDYTKTLAYMDHNKLWKLLQEMGMNARLLFLSPEKPVCRSRSNS